MARPVLIEIRGVEEAVNLLARIGIAAPQAARTVVQELGQAVFIQSQAETPQRTGELKGSGRIEPLAEDARGWYVEIHYGRAGAFEYAAIQHWARKYHHPRGGKHHYLYDPYRRYIRGFTRMVNGRVGEAISKA